MPALPFSQALTANQLGYNPAEGWQFERVPIQWARGAAVSLMVNCTDANARMAVFSGSQTIQERAQVQSGGTAGVTPSQLNSAPLVFIAQPGDKLKLQIDEVAGGTPTINGLLQMEPM